MRSSSFSSSFLNLSCSCLFIVHFRHRLSGFRRPDSKAHSPCHIREAFLEWNLFSVTGREARRSDRHLITLISQE